MSVEDSQALAGAKNVRLAATEDDLRVYCDLSQSFGASSSGKSVVIATSSGNRPLGKSGAFLGLNLFTKSLEKRDVTEKGTASLRTDDFTEVNEGFSWRIEPDNKTLCMRVLFAAIKERPASSGKSVLLATSSGNKAVGGTGIMCGFNLYRPTQSSFNAAALADQAEVGKTVKPGDTASFDGGFTVHYASASSVEVTLRVSDEALRSTKVVSLPSDARLDNGTTMTFHVGAVVAKRSRSKTADEQSTPPPSTQPANDKSHNCCFVARKDDSDANSLTVHVTFDPTKTSGRTGSAKSFSVSSSAGFQVLYDDAHHPLCRASFNAYRPAPALDDETVKNCVKDVLSQRSDAEIEKVTLKQLMSDVMAVFGLQEGHKDLIKKAVEAAAVGEMARIRSQGSQSSTE